ncbi:hypothetical protein EDD29_6437 [Actinocorallia herbida]|uniref:Uncharacterized protein n=1 Tax=Actinocorallia herbida TaxID=58109 RepID=A0A3N1D6L5_9ACTN|nr:hypothetical protein [Actinocorallia herbida]ROO88758.1 hypothetical protein EDD29_6437 [Actinocorallia herbida]
MATTNRTTTAKAATTKRPQAPRTTTGKANTPAAAPAPAPAATGSPAPDQATPTAPAPAATVKAPQPYIRKDRTRRATGSRVQVLDLRAADAPADAIAPAEGDGKPLNYAARCVTHEQHQHFATYAQAYAAAKSSADWCGTCKPTEQE